MTVMVVMMVVVIVVVMVSSGIVKVMLAMVMASTAK